MSLLDADKRILRRGDVQSHQSLMADKRFSSLSIDDEDPSPEEEIFETARKINRFPIK